MNPLIKKLMDGANLDEQAAGKAVEVVASFLEEKLPEPAKGMATKIVRGLDVESVENLAEGAMDKIGKMF